MNTPAFFLTSNSSQHINFNRGIFALLGLCVVLFFSACSSDKDTSQATPAQSLYATAKAEYDAANYAAAINDFKAILANNPDLSTQELAQYYLSLCYYYLLQYSEAENQFTVFINTFADTVTYYDAAYYWRGRSRQKQNNFAAAITDYQFVINRNTSVYVDNAQFQIGNTHYEQGVALIGATTPDLQQAFTSLDLAVGEFSSFMTNNATSTYYDDAAYFIGRAYQRMAETLQQGLVVSAGHCLVETTCYDNARAAYAEFETNANLTSSAYADSALYFSARTYQSQSSFDFAKARTQFNKLLNNAAYATSSWRDDAQYQVSITYYDEAIALIASNESLAATGFENAISEFNKLLLSPGNGQTFSDNNRWDNALYYRGRAFERLTALIENSQQPDLLLGSTVLSGLTAIFLGNNTTPTLIDMYTVSRQAMQAVINFDATAPYADDAQLEIGVLYQNQAGNTTITPVDSDRFNLLAQAETAYLAVASVGNCPTSCGSVDNALYNRAKVYSDTLMVSLGNAITPDPFIQPVTYDLARLTFDQLIQTYPTSIWVDNAKYHKADLSRRQGSNNLDAAILERALSDYAEVILFDPAGQYVDNAIYYIGLIYHDTSSFSAAGPSAECTLGNNWFAVYDGLSKGSNYQFSYNNANVNIDNTALKLSSTVLLPQAQTYVANYNAGNYDCTNILGTAPLSSIINAPTIVP